MIPHKKRRPPFPGVLQAGSNCEDRHHGRHHEQPELQRPARPSQKLLDSAIENFKDSIHGSLFLTKSGDRVAVSRIQSFLSNRFK